MEVILLQSIKNVKHQVLNKSRQCQKKMIVSKKQNDNKLNIRNNLMIETNNYLNYIEINEGTLDLIIKFPSGSKVSIADGKMKRVLQPNNCECTRCL
jgi:hypothetical protein